MDTLGWYIIVPAVNRISYIKKMAKKNGKGIVLIEI